MMHQMEMGCMVYFNVWFILMYKYIYIFLYMVVQKLFKLMQIRHKINLYITLQYHILFLIFSLKKYKKNIDIMNKMLAYMIQNFTVLCIHIMHMVQQYTYVISLCLSFAKEGRYGEYSPVRPVLAILKG